MECSLMTGFLVAAQVKASAAIVYPYVDLHPFVQASVHKSSLFIIVGSLNSFASFDRCTWSY